MTPNSKQVYMLLLLFLGFLTGCSTTVIDSEIVTDDETGADIVVSLNLDPELMASTRSTAAMHANHLLRYVVCLYSVPVGVTEPKILQDGSNLVRRIDQLDKDGKDIRFRKVQPNEDGYFVTVFADYIEATAKKSGDRYEEKYYDTSGTGNPDRIVCKADPEDFFNNHNLDCFAGMSKRFAKKNNQQHIQQMTLKRIVSYVEVASTSGSIDALKDISVTYTHTDQYSYGGTSSLAYSASKKVNLDVADRDERKLLFCYMFNASALKEGLKQMDLTLNPNEGYTFEKPIIKVPTNQIPLVANTKYRIKGDLLNVTGVPSNKVSLTVTVPSESEWGEDLNIESENF